MKKTVYLFLILALVATQLVAQKAKLVKIPIAFYNVENLFDTVKGKNNDRDFTPEGSNQWVPEKYQQKLQNIAHVISEIAGAGPALIGLAEVENRGVLEDLIKQPSIASHKYSIVHYDSPDKRGIDCALLYNPAIFKLQSSGVRPVVFEDNPNWKTRDILYTTGTIAGETFHILVAHWPSRAGGEAISAPKRLRAAEIMKSVADSLLQAYPNSKAILMGDFNDDPISPSVRNGLKIKDNPDKVDYSELYTPMLRLYNRGLGTLAYRDTWNLFDIIAVSGSLLGEDLSTFKLYCNKEGNRGFIFRKDYLVQQSGRYKGYPRRSLVRGVFDEAGYSDHLPVYIYIVREFK